MLKSLKQLFLLIFFWIICFDVHRIFFSIHHFSKIKTIGFGNWMATFIYSIRLDFGTACALSAFPVIFILLKNHFNSPVLRKLFKITVFFLFIIISLIHAGETVAYSEWNHKLTSRVFMHLSNPDEVTRTANYGMIIWFIIHFLIEFIIGRFIFRKLFPKTEPFIAPKTNYWIVGIPITCLILSLQFLALRGGWQQIPLNIDSAAFSNQAIANDVSINSNYFFSKSYLLYNRSEIDSWLPKVNKKKAKKAVDSWFAYPKEHSNQFLTTTRPNIVVIVLEGWSAQAISAFGNVKNSTPSFDKLISEGYFFDNIYATATTSEIGNSTIFSGNPSIPEVSISMQPEKHRKLYCLNQDVESWGYHSSYIFSGDLKYGNIGSYFMEHGFDVIKDEADFPSSLPRGKLNFFDKDLYSFLLDEINSNKKPFLQCAFTGSTHSPYDQPNGKGKVFTGEEKDYMNSIVYSDNCLGEFINKCKKFPWYKNTLFVFISDHGHATAAETSPTNSAFYKIPLLFYGEVIDEKYKGKRNHFIGSQGDLAATLIHQMKGETKHYPWSKDMMNPLAPQFAFHSIVRGYGWVSPKGNYTYSLDQKRELDNSIAPKDKKAETQKSHYFLTTIYDAYKKL